MKHLSKEGRERLSELVMPVLLVGIILGKLVIAGTIVSTGFMALVNNPNVSPIETLAFLWGVVLIAAVVFFWWGICYACIAYSHEAAIPASEHTAEERRKAFKLVDTNQKM